MGHLMNWYLKRFSELSTDELYELLKLRIDVFVVEQTCFYPDLDNLDRHPETLHLFAYKDEHIVAYCRLLPPNLVYENESAIGRVVISERGRGLGLGHQLMQRANEQIDKLWPNDSCHISAQEHLKLFYQQHGFKQISQMYLEDDIPHIAMRRESYNKPA